MTRIFSLASLLHLIKLKAQQMLMTDAPRFGTLSVPSLVLFINNITGMLLVIITIYIRMI
jgi:hypothetical protein